MDDFPFDPLIAEGGEEIERLWREVDRRLNTGEIDAEGAIRELIGRGAVRKSNGWRIHESSHMVYVLEPARQNLVVGPRLLLDFGRGYGGPRLYRPVSHEVRIDTGLFS